MGADQLDERVLNGTLGVALGVGLDVAEVTNVAVLVRGRAVVLAVGVDCGTPVSILILSDGIGNPREGERQGAEDSQ